MPGPTAVGRSPRRTFGASDRIATYLTPPKLSSLPRETEQLEFSSRSLVFPNDGSRLLRAWGPPDFPWVLGVEESGSRWKVTAWGVDAPTARAGVRALFSLDHPLEEFYAQVRAEPVLRGTERRFRGLRLPRDASVYEALIHSIVGQQLSVRAANTIKGRLIEAVDAFVSVEGQAVPRMPSPAELTALGTDGLRRIGASGAKARALLSLAQRRAAGALEDAQFLEGSSEAAIERLDAEPGVGRWTAENALLRGVGRRDLFVAGDLGLRVALDRFGVVPRSAPETDARAWADRHYPGWGSYATLYLWRRLVTDAVAAG
ncbi:MAG: hypothetical protein L3J73_01505 [Thermoplasmata archaeon]|nr:hypothetical protein [Thermoplasmata archaeon]